MGKFFKYAKYAAILAVVAVVGISTLYIPNCLVVNEYEIGVKNWNKDLGGLKIVFFADNHTDGFFGTLNKLKRIVRTINGQKPDIVLYGGDIMRNFTSPFISRAEVASEFAKIKSKYGVYGVYGNHDWQMGMLKLRESFKDSNVKFLENESVLIETDKGAFALVGLADYSTRYINYTASFRDIKNYPKDTPIIVLSHSPDAFPECPKDFSLMLAGHTHGGQIVVPFYGALLVPSKYGNKYALGLFEERGKKMLVTNGAGSALIFARIPYKPEIAVLKLAPEKH